MRRNLVNPRAALSRKVKVYDRYSSGSQFDHSYFHSGYPNDEDLGCEGLVQRGQPLLLMWTGDGSRGIGTGTAVVHVLRLNALNRTHSLAFMSAVRSL